VTVKQTKRAARLRGLPAGWSIAGPVAGLVVVALSSTAVAAPLKPDLQPLNPSPIKLCEEDPDAIRTSEACVGGGRTVIRLHGYVANAGAGPLEYAPVPPAEDVPSDCHGDGNPDIDGDGDSDDNDVLIRQRVFDDVNANGVFNRSIDTSSVDVDIGCRYYHPEHDHYHVEAFARYSLQSVATGDIARSGGKISFCVADTDPFNLSLPGAPPASSGGFYSDATCETRLSTQGISVGWSDHYGWKLSGQEIDVTGMPSGEYCLIAEADPEDRLDETIETNNQHRRQLNVNPASAPATGYVNLPSTAGCEIGEPPPPGSTSLLRPNATVSSAWRVVGASSPWAAIDDPLVPPANPDSSDYIQPRAGGQTTEVGLQSVPTGGAVPTGATVYFHAKTYGGDTSLRVRVLWGGAQRETYTVGTDGAYSWRQIPISPVPTTQSALDDLRLQFTSLGGFRTIVRAAYVELRLP
jgi:Lysyl oxidase